MVRRDGLVREHGLERLRRADDQHRAVEPVETGTNLLKHADSRKGPNLGSTLHGETHQVHALLRKYERGVIEHTSGLDPLHAPRIEDGLGFCLWFV